MSEILPNREEIEGQFRWRRQGMPMIQRFNACVISGNSLSSGEEGMAKVESDPEHVSPHLKAWLYPLVNREGQYFQAQNRDDVIRHFFKKIILEIEFEGKSEETKG